MSEQNNGDPAFPDLKATKVESNYGGVYVDQYEAIGGLSIRDYFAAKALQVHLNAIGGAKWNSEEDCAKEVSRMSYVIADAMIKARG